VNRTKIEWCDWTWNPIVGCSPASAGCANCYAAAISKRFGLPWGRPVFKPERLGEPGRVKKPGRVFVCSMSDIGHENVCPLWRAEIRKAMAAAPWHEYIILTKRPGAWMAGFAGKAWLGVSAENQATADARIPVLQLIDRARRFVSVEPMLDPVSLQCSAFNGADSFSAMVGIHWVIAGPETGPKARECRPEWIADLAAECEQAGVPFFDKRDGGLRREWPGRNPKVTLDAHSASARSEETP